jgi:hypothetical protein
VIQLATMPAQQLDRNGHIWLDQTDGLFMCVSCGALTGHPPDHPEPEGSDWLPEFGFQKVPEHTRTLMPPPPVKPPYTEAESWGRIERRS